MDECGCALCQLVAAQCGKVLEFRPQRKASIQTLGHRGGIHPKSQSGSEKVKKNMDSISAVYY